ncbi:MAG TPA: DMT family transporter [candidate division Zixibacteria bacterium]|nr:DMT family transporter [candidate division Zixibacteria bacterium]
MPPELFALANAFFFALHNMFTKKGLRYSNPATAVIVSLVINMIFLWGTSLVAVPLSSLTGPGVLIFVLVGLFQPGLTRLLTYKGIETLGVAITDPIRATTPLFSALVAIAFLGEQLTVPIFAATLLIIAGVTLLSLRGGPAQEIRWLHVLYPLSASVLAGCSQVLRKFGLASVPHPFLAAAVTATSSFAVSVATLWLVEKKTQTWKFNRRCLPYYTAAGVAVSIGMVSIYYALDLGKVTVVIPISSTGPFFSLLLSALFLRDAERVTFRIVAGAAMIVGGVLLITLWK